MEVLNWLSQLDIFFLSDPFHLHICIVFLKALNFLMPATKFIFTIGNRSFNRSFLVLRCIVFCRVWSRFITTVVYASNFSQ